MDVAGDVALEAADDFFGAEALGSSAGGVCAGGFVPAEAAEDDSVEDCVRGSVTASVEAVSRRST